MKKWILIPIIFLLGLLEAAFFESFKVGGASPDLLLVTVVIVSALFPFEFVWILSISAFAGFVKDIFSINSFGINTFIFPLLAFLAMRMARKISVDNYGVICAATGVISLLADILSRIILSHYDNFIPVGIFFRVAILRCIYAAIITPLVWKVFKQARIHLLVET